MYPAGKEPTESVCKTLKVIRQTFRLSKWFFFLQLLKPGSGSFKLPNGARSDISRVTAPLGASMCRSVTKLLPKRVGKSFFPPRKHSFNVKKQSFPDKTAVTAASMLTCYRSS